MFCISFLYVMSKTYVKLLRRIRIQNIDKAEHTRKLTTRHIYKYRLVLGDKHM